MIDKERAWAEKTVGELCLRVTSGGTPSRSNSDFYLNGTVPWIKSGELPDGYVTKYDEYISTEAIANSSAKILPKDTVLMAMYGATVGMLGILSEPAACNQAACAMVVDREKADPRWLFYALKNDRDHIVSRANGAAQQNLSGGTIKGLSFIAPGLMEQQAIAEVLGALDDKIAANTKLVQTSDELAGVLTRRTLDFGNRVPLSSVAQVTMGSSPPGVTLNEVGAGEVFYQGVRDFGVRFPVNRVWTTGPVRFAEKLDTLLSVRAPVGRANLAQELTCIGRGIASIRSIEAHPYSIFHRLRDDPEMWAPYEAEGTVFGSINRGQLDKLAMPAILADDSDRLEAQLAAVELRVASALDENRTLAATRDALLPQLMSGALCIKNAKNAIEEVL